MELKKYNGFLLESLVHELIQESMLRYMDDFKKVLDDIEQDNIGPDAYRVLKFLKNISNKDIKTSQNLIDIDDDGKISFIPDSKIKVNEDCINLKVNSANDRLLNILLDHPIIDKLKIPREGLNFPLYLNEIPSNNWVIKDTYMGKNTSVQSYERYILYLLKNKDDENYHVVAVYDKYLEEMPFIQDYEISDTSGLSRNSMKIGRFINRMLDVWFSENPNTGDKRENYKASDIEKFVNIYTAKVLFNRNIFEYFEIVSGEDIKYWYNESNYHAKTGQLGSSCMRYQGCQDFFNIYIDNPEVCQLLIFKDAGKEKINGRALLWTDIDGNKYMDRAYTSKDNYKNLFDKWAENNNYDKIYDTYAECRIKIKNKDYGEYPYMDSFIYFKFNDDREKLESPGDTDSPAYLHSVNDRPDRPFYILQETNGSYSKRL